MHWHAEQVLQFSVLTGPGEEFSVRQLTLRGFRVPDGYERHLDFDAVAQAILCGERAFIFGAKTGGDGLSRAEWRSLGAMLRESFGVERIVADRDQRRIEWPTARA